MSAPIGIYVRVSRKGDREDERFHSPKEQVDRATSLVGARGLVPGPVFEDIDVSGATSPADRPGMGELLRQVDDGRLGGIAAYSLDRLSREPAHGDALVRRVTKAGGVLLTPDIPDAIDSPTGEFTFGMLLQVAKLYRSQARARFGSAIERAISAGIPVGPVPLGYRQRDDRRLEVDPEAASIVRVLFARRAAGTGWVPLWRYLNEATGREWSRNAARKIIANRIYATGRLEYGDVVSDVECGAIVDEPLWHAAQRVYTGPRPKRDPASAWLLTGLARCGECGRSLAPWRGNATRKNRKGERVPVKTRARRYRCVHGCKTSVDAPKLERFVVLQSFATGDAIEARQSAPDVASLQEAVDVAQRRLDQVLAPEARDALGELWAADVKARRAELDAALTALGEARDDAGIGATPSRLRDVWDDLSPVDRRAAIALYWKTIGVRHNGTTTIKFVARGPLAEAEIDLPTEEVV